MLDLIEQHRGDLESLCRKYHVKTLELFGSAAGGNFDAAQSDFDFLLEFLPDAPNRIFSGYFDLKFDLERLFGRKVDLVMPSAIRNRYFLQAVNQQRKLVYAA
ncbi:MAG: DNA polymerase subunit beta [Gemmataceae bacterium]|nr:DNA polymerase subunit beta [Gemmataceae bacterium]